MTPTDPMATVPALWSSLGEGLHQGRRGRMARDVVRLLLVGVSPRAIASFAAAHDARHGEWGPTHGLAVAVDALRFLPWFAGTDAAHPLAQALDVVSDGTQRRPLRPLLPSEEPGTELDAVEAELERRVELEDLDGAQALVRGMVAAGWELARLEAVFFRLVSAHFLSFGHRLIYTVKVFELLEDSEPSLREPLLTALVAGIVSGTRENVLPRWKGVRERIAAMEGDAILIHEHMRAQAVAMDPRWRVRLEEALVDGTEERALYMLEHSLRAGLAPSEVVDVLSGVAAERMMRFDVAWDADPTVEDDWLSVTHGQTTVHALRVVAARLDHPMVLRLFLFVGRFLHRTSVLDLPEDRRPAVPESGPAEPVVVLEAIASGDAARAMEAARACLEETETTAELRGAIMRWAVRDAAVAPIVVAHVLKNTVAAWDEYDATGDRRHILGLLRFVASRPTQRWVAAATERAIAFVEHGKLPKTRAS